MKSSTWWCNECKRWNDHDTEGHVVISDVTEDRQKLFEIMERAIPAQGRLTSGDSADLDYSHDMLDDFFEDLTKEIIVAELNRQVYEITSELICCDAYDNAQPMRDKISEATGSERFKLAGDLYPRSHDLCYWAGAIVYSLNERIKKLESK